MVVKLGWPPVKSWADSNCYVGGRVEPGILHTQLNGARHTGWEVSSSGAYLVNGVRHCILNRWHQAYRNAAYPWPWLKQAHKHWKARRQRRTHVAISLTISARRCRILYSVHADSDKILWWLHTGGVGTGLIVGGFGVYNYSGNWCGNEWRLIWTILATNVEMSEHRIELEHENECELFLQLMWKWVKMKLNSNMNKTWTILAINAECVMNGRWLEWNKQNQGRILDEQIVFIKGRGWPPTHSLVISRVFSVCSF